MLAVGHGYDFLYLLYVVLYVSHAYCWHGSCYIDKTVIHIIIGLFDYLLFDYLGY